MPKKKPTSKPADKHKSGFMVRLPEEYRIALTELCEKTDRTFTAEVRRALDAHFKESGLKPPAK